MPTDNVQTLPGVFRADLEERTPVATCLATAAQEPMSDIVIVGRALNGNIVAISSHPDCDAAIGLLYRGLSWLAEARQELCPDKG